MHLTLLIFKRLAGERNWANIRVWCLRWLYWENLLENFWPNLFTDLWGGRVNQIKSNKGTMVPTRIPLLHHTATCHCYSKMQTWPFKHAFLLYFYSQLNFHHLSFLTKGLFSLKIILNLSRPEVEPERPSELQINKTFFEVTEVFFWKYL